MNALAAMRGIYDLIASTSERFTSCQQLNAEGFGNVCDRLEALERAVFGPGRHDGTFPVTPLHDRYRQFPSGGHKARSRPGAI